MVDDVATTWGGNIKLGRKPATDELLLGNSNGDFALTPLSTILPLSVNLQTALDGLSTTQGAIIYRGVSGWVALAPGTAGYVLATNGAGADPSWIDKPAPPSIQTDLDSISSTQGTILYRGASAWVALAPGTAGQILSTNGASANPSWINNNVNPWVYGVKLADQSVTSSITPVSATDMSFSVAANTYYSFEFRLYFTQNSGGIRIDMTFPTSPTALLYGLLDSQLATQTAGVDLIVLTSGNTTDLEIVTMVSGFLNNGANAGTVQFRFAQTSLNANATVMKKGSWFQYRTV